jgi:hypothetical protein
MPYLHWETDEAREKMCNVIKDIESPETAGSRTARGVEVKDLPLSELGKKVLPKVIRYRVVKNADPDEKLLRKHLLSERPVHIRRTLDQSYYWTLKDTSARDRDQVVYRATVQPDENPRIPRIVMVDQLWMWILDGSKNYLPHGMRYIVADYSYRTCDNELPKTLGKKETGSFRGIQNDTGAACF